MLFLRPWQICVKLFLIHQWPLSIDTEEWEEHKEVEVYTMHIRDWQPYRERRSFLRSKRCFLQPCYTLASSFPWIKSPRQCAHARYLGCMCTFLCTCILTRWSSFESAAVHVVCVCVVIHLLCGCLWSQASGLIRHFCRKNKTDSGGKGKMRETPT